MGRKTLHGERGDKCRRETGTVRCRERQREDRDELRDPERDGEKEIMRYLHSDGK